MKIKIVWNMTTWRLLSTLQRSLLLLPSWCKKFKLFMEYSEAATSIIICRFTRHHVSEDVIQAACKMSWCFLCKFLEQGTSIFQWYFL